MVGQAPKPVKVRQAGLTSASSTSRHAINDYQGYRSEVQFSLGIRRTTAGNQDLVATLKEEGSGEILDVATVTLQQNVYVRLELFGDLQRSVSTVLVVTFDAAVDELEYTFRQRRYPMYMKGN